MKPLSACHVLVTPTSYGKHEPALIAELEACVGRVTWNPTGKPLTSAQLQPLLADVDGFIAGLDAIDAAALAAAPCLRVVARYGVGVDNVDLEAAHARRVVVTNTPGANAGSVAELTIALMLDLLRPILNAAQQTRSGGWPRLNGQTLEGKCVGLVGLGAIGRGVAQRLSGFGCRVLAYDVVVDAAFVERWGVEVLPLAELLAQADIVSLHLPVLPATRGLVDATFLAQMQRGAYFVNTARGELVDEDALYGALTSGHIAGAALDAFAQEPPTASPLPALPQVIATPHMGAHTDGATSAMGRMALADCLAVLRGDEPKYRVV
jgi:phosphoglycerate dehydrogenase-like enzyme